MAKSAVWSGLVGVLSGLLEYVPKSVQFVITPLLRTQKCKIIGQAGVTALKLGVYGAKAKFLECGTQIEVR